MAARRIRGSVLCVQPSEGLTPVSAPCVFACVLLSQSCSHSCIWQWWTIPRELWETQTVAGSLDVQWCLWPTDPVIQKHQLLSVSVELSDITLPSELHPVTSDHCKGRRQGTRFIPKTDYQLQTRNTLLHNRMISSIYTFAIFSFQLLAWYGILHCRTASWRVNKLVKWQHNVQYLGHLGCLVPDLDIYEEKHQQLRHDSVKN